MADEAALRALLERLPAGAADEAPVELLVLRGPQGRRTVPGRVHLDPDQGLVGDRWGLGLQPDPQAQVTLMRIDLARVLAADPAVFGDNLLAGLDTSARNLPPGTLLQVGSARAVVTPKPHTGCRKFATRAGSAALALLREARFAPLQLRGVHLRVLEAGELALGDAIRVLSRG